MKNIPRIFINEKLSTGALVPLTRDTAHYLTKVMRTSDCLVFNDGAEFNARVSDNLKFLTVRSQTEHTDPSNDLVFCFAPIKQLDDMLNMATQMGVARLQPVLTDRTNAHHINWARLLKIIIEAAEQSNRNSIPVLSEPIKFADLDKKGLIFADERAAHGRDIGDKKIDCPKALLVGPEGGFSESEFAALDSNGAVGISLGKTILRAQTAAVAALTKVL